MIKREEVLSYLDNYDFNDLRIATICSHSALQIFLGAKELGFKTLGICLKDRKFVYEAFPEAKPDEFILLESYKDLLRQEIQDYLIKRNCIIIPHGSFIAYLGVGNILNNFYVPMFGNRKSLLWESNRKKQIELFKEAGVNFPKIYESLEDVELPVIIKYHGAKGGEGYKKIFKKEELKGINIAKCIIQEFLIGVRYYFHFFYSPLFNDGFKASEGRLELLGIDKRIETIDECYRTLPQFTEEYVDYVVSGNIPLILRESLLYYILNDAKRIVEASIKLFYPGLLGPFCLETFYHPKYKGFKIFEISNRIVAGTSVYTKVGSLYSWATFGENMYMGKRIAFEIAKAMKEDKLEMLIW